LSETVGKLTVDRPTATGSEVQNVGRIAKTNISVSGGTGTAHVLVQGPGRTNDIPNDIGDEDIIAAASATNYTPSASTVEGHLAGIDTALGSVGGGGGTPSGVAGAIQFSDGSAFDDDDANLHWDDGNNRLGVGTNTPSETLHVNGTIRQTVTSAVLVANGNGNLVAATNLTDTAYSTTDTTDAAVDVYTASPAAAAAWQAPPPATVAEALNRLALHVVTIPGAPPTIP